MLLHPSAIDVVLPHSWNSAEEDSFFRLSTFSFRNKIESFPSLSSFCVLLSRERKFSSIEYYISSQLPVPCLSGHCAMDATFVCFAALTVQRTNQTSHKIVEGFPVWPFCGVFDQTQHATQYVAGGTPRWEYPEHKTKREMKTITGDVFRLAACDKI